MILRRASARLPVPASPGSATARVFRGLLLCAGILIAVHVLAHLTWDIHRALPRTWLEVVDLAHEYSFATWLTVVVWSALGALCLGLGVVQRRIAWPLLGAFFFYLSADDATMLHERIGWVNSKVAEGTGTYAWIIVLGPVLAVVGIAAFSFLWRVLARDRRARWQLLLAFAFLGLALLLELVEKRLFETGLRWRGFGYYRYTQTVEEALELFAPILLLGSVGRLLEAELRARFTRVALVVHPASKQKIVPPRDAA